MDNYKTYEHHHGVLVVRSNAVSDLRMDVAAYELKEAGFEVEVITEVPFYKASHYDTILCCRPGVMMIPFLHACLRAGRNVIVDLDDDFNSIPKHNPAFPYTGGGHPTYLTDLRRLLQSGVTVTYASPILADRYHHDGIIVQNTWDDRNPNWLMPKVEHPEYINIGFLGTATHREDFNLCEPAVKRILKDYPHTNIVIGGDDQIYNRFVDVPESRKLFMPGVPYEDYPLMFRYIDVLLVPLRDTHFNRAKSDIKLVEAGATRTPWIASPMPVYKEWDAGGMFAETEQEWYDGLAEMVTNIELRTVLAYDGNLKAKERRASLVCKKWVEIIEELAK